MLRAAAGQSPASAAPGRRARPNHGFIAVASDATLFTPAGGLADRYASALYAEAEEKRALDQVVAEMAALGRLIDESADFRRLLESPTIDVTLASKAALAVLSSEGFSKLMHNFVGVVAANRRLRQLRTIVAAFAALVAARRGVVTARVISAHPLDDIQLSQLRARLIEAGYGNVEIVKEVDPSLLGGLVLKIGARLYDSSLKSRLQRLQYAMKGAA